MFEGFANIYYEAFDTQKFVNRRLVILLMIPFSILIFVIFAPIILRQLFPGNITDKTWHPTSKACFGIVIPQDIVPFILTEKISFMDAREKKNKCFGFDVYF